MTDVWITSEGPFFTNIPQDLVEAVADLREKLWWISLCLNEPQDLTTVLSSIAAEIEDGTLTRLELEDLNFDIAQPNTKLRNQSQFRMSCIAFICVENMISAGNGNLAWPLICHTNYLIGTTENGIQLLTKAEEQLKKTISGKAAREKGGKKTKDKYDKVRAQLAHLLAECAPSEGWTSQRQAIDVIHDHLQNYVTAASLGVALPDIHATANKWLSEYAEIKEVYTAHAAKK